MANLDEMPCVARVEDQQKSERFKFSLLKALFPVASSNTIKNVSRMVSKFTPMTFQTTHWDPNIHYRASCFFHRDPISCGRSFSGWNAGFGASSMTPKWANSSSSSDPSPPRPTHCMKYKNHSEPYSRSIWCLLFVFNMVSHGSI